MGLALALVALLINVLIPPGYMTVASGQGPSLVICSGHGPVQLAPDGLAKPIKAPKARPDAPCAFAGHGITGPSAMLPALTIQSYAIAARPARCLTGLAPGRGMAAPPPPSQAPPLDL